MNLSLLNYQYSVLVPPKEIEVNFCRRFTLFIVIFKERFLIKISELLVNNYMYIKIFQCKEKMRPVKKALRALDNPDQTLSEADQVARTRACLTQIGNQIDICVDAYPDPEKKVEWRSNLWYFVSKFTNFDAKQLYRLYKYGLKKNESSSKKDGKHKENVKVSITTNLD